MSELQRDSRGRFIKGNREGCKFGNSGGVAAETDPNEAGSKGHESRRKKRTERETYEALMNTLVPQSFSGIQESLRKLGYEPSDRNFHLAVAVKMLLTAIGDDRKAAIQAAGHIHKVLSDGKLDITTNGRDITPEPITVEIIDSREQVERTEDDGL